MQDVVPFGQIFYCTARCKQGRDTITKKILLLGKRLNAKRDELGDSRPLGHREYYTKNIFRAPSSSYSRTDYKCPRASRLRRAAVDICNRFCATRPCGTACSGHDKPPDGGAEKGLFRSARRRAHRTDGCGQAFCEMARLSRDQSGLRRLPLIEPYVQFSRIRLSVWDP